MEFQARIEVFLELLSCAKPLFYWRYDGQGALLHSTCSSEKMLDAVLRHTGGLEYAYTAPKQAPLILNGDARLMWIAAREMSGNSVVEIHVLGPFFGNEPHPDCLDELLSAEEAQASPQWKHALEETLHTLPFLSMPFFTQYAVMLHYLVTGEKIDVSAVQYQLGELTPDSAFPRISTRKPPKDRIQIYRAERALLNAVRDGDLDGAAAMANAADVARVRQYTDNPLRNAQIACTTFAAVCTRAAIEGGLSTTMSYCLGDAYIKSFFAAKSLSEVADIKNQMYMDFIRHVRACRSNPKYSKMVQGSCDYIELHLREPLSIDILATRLICPHVLNAKLDVLSMITSNLPESNTQKHCFPHRIRLLLKSQSAWASIRETFLQIRSNNVWAKPRRNTAVKRSILERVLCLQSQCITFFQPWILSNSLFSN